MTWESARVPPPTPSGAAPEPPLAPVPPTGLQPQLPSAGRWAGLTLGPDLSAAARPDLSAAARPDLGAAAPRTPEQGSRLPRPPSLSPTSIQTQAQTQPLDRPPLSQTPSLSPTHTQIQVQVQVQAQIQPLDRPPVLGPGPAQDRTAPSTKDRPSVLTAPSQPPPPGAPAEARTAAAAVPEAGNRSAAPSTTGTDAGAGSRPGAGGRASGAQVGTRARAGSPAASSTGSGAAGAAGTTETTGRPGTGNRAAGSTGAQVGPQAGTGAGAGRRTSTGVPVGSQPGARGRTPVGAGSQGSAPSRGRAGRAGRAEGGGRPRHRAYRQRTAGPLVVADCVAAVAAAYAVRPGLDPVLLAPLLGALLPAQRRATLYRPGFAPAAFDELPKLAVGAALAWGLLAAVPGSALGWGALVTGLALTVAGECGLRALVHGVRRRHARRHPGSTLIVGGDASVQQVAAVLHAHPEYGMHPVGIAATGLVPGQEQGPGPGHGTAPGDFPLPVLTGHGDITRAVIQNSVRHAVVTGPPTLDARTTATVRLLAAQGACVWQVDAGPGGGPGSAAPGHLWGFACRRLEPYPPPPRGRWGKRALDFVLAASVLLPLAPLLAACALAVRLADGPGVIFRQERIGLGGRPFTLLKFRTLRPSDAGESATRWSIAHDRRMSAVGRLLRRTSLDELPQLWNVLRGDMSLVGPRPERPYFVEQFSQTHPGYQDRHRMPAGITGLAQVHGLRGDTSIADRARFDNHYIDSWSLWQDIRILLRTATSLFRFGGS